jgi:hypothetical protein
MNGAWLDKAMRDGTSKHHDMYCQSAILDLGQSCISMYHRPRLEVISQDRGGVMEQTRGIPY